MEVAEPIGNVEEHVGLSEMTKLNVSSENFVKKASQIAPFAVLHEYNELVRTSDRPKDLDGVLGAKL